MGRFYEFYEKQAEIAQDLLGLKKMKTGRGFRIRCGFPLGSGERYLRRLMRLGLSVHIVREEVGRLSGVKKRRMAEGWISSSEGERKAV